ncbi:MAG: hypothetical protein JXR51_02450 [Bacteroidales bacterium]|nr:hypothetical protein [Bacteroidales bacterium]
MPEKNKEIQSEDNSFPGIFEERQIFGRTLIKFIESIEPKDIKNTENPEEIEDTRVISIDADWGFGKTTFMNSLKTELENNNFTVFTFNAWENDLEEDPLASFVRSLIPQIIHSNNEDFNDIKKYQEKMGTFISTANTILALTTEALPYIPKLDFINMKKEIAENAKLIFNKESAAIKCAAEVSQTTKLKNDFIDALNEITPENKNKIIVLIDELDRCKPTFAVELLERVKHFFDTGKYLFIFTINSKQLASSVKQIYGVGFDETGYFRRFFDYEFYLPLPNRISYIEKKTEILIKRFNSNYNFLIIFKKFLIETDFSLRKYNTIFNEINLLLRLQGNDSIPFNESIYITFIVIIKYYEPSFFYNILIKKEKNELSRVNEKKLIEIEFKNYPNLKKVNEIFMPEIIDPEFEGKVNQVRTIRISFESWLSESLKIKKLTMEIIDKLTKKNTKFDTYILMYTNKIDLNKKSFTFVKMRNKENPGTDIILQAYKILPDPESLYNYSTPVEINKLDFNFISKKTINKILLLNNLEQKNS